MSKTEPDKSKLTRRDILALILASYRATLPYLLIFVVSMLLVTYLITELLLR